MVKGLDVIQKPFLAHIGKGGAEQTLRAHCRKVSCVCGFYATSLKLSRTASLIGLLHDMGKATESFQAYLLSSGKEAKSPHVHAPIGGMFAYQRWYQKEGEKKMAQIIALCIHGHHAGLADCLDDSGSSPFLKSFDESYFREAVDGFLREVATEEELDGLFYEACEEMKRFSLDEFGFGCLTRMMLSILVDADRWDTACFEYGTEMEERPRADWNRLSETLQTCLKVKYQGEESSLSRIRSKISQVCHEAAENSGGIFTLSVPTGGGKTLSSLRFALRHAERTGKQKIFYIIPYNTILDQNAADIREALGEYPGILEHHSNVVQETEGEEVEYRRLTERWDSDIILTSLVQFLNACYNGKNTDVRRMHQLKNSVLIFDEVQALPKHCKVLFEKAVSFLVGFSICTVVLCTATQPNFKLRSEEMVQGLDFDVLKRTEYYPQIQEMLLNEEAARRLVSLVEEGVLMVVNTKAVAWDIYKKSVELLQEAGMSVCFPETGYSEEEIRRLARTEGNILCVHLTTHLCPAHRLEWIRWVKLWTKEGGRSLCVSTALIEAGINLSFPVVVRSLAGLPSIVQAAGRCNRNREYAIGKVYIWELSEEKLEHLPDIQRGGNCSRAILHQWTGELDSAEALKTYFNLEGQELKKKKIEKFLMEDKRKTLVDLLGKNRECRQAAEKDGTDQKLSLHQSFRTAGNAFYVIKEETETVLVPYEAGKDLILELYSRHDLKQEQVLLRKAQQYSVSLYPNVFDRLQKEGAIDSVGESGVLVLKEGYYTDAGGVSIERKELEDIYF